ncbi:1-(5-phosphoribosyl)-5-[(5-phosphoribosylamino)methylideneamino] imidazole-4-carboxamide isomerase [Caballeronia terrestris]|uniref:1-(5-phosphoribosyl)-5-[(5-phosphoribosylamino)methylideneamino] imidazole-4-carboxamide isomerase n=1 Tax=Caballeronia terrestris TaxID=1226301 RepID=A0A158F0H1_9BURK|nr:1-(5-phosphoribosyl)-5-[(5-phosphoribosylamino)methylideneamino] imidazole-4-carboxamide isomerase [Caballeronia terrestris]
MQVRVIPVVDLLDGVAVHAVRGERSRYRPVASRLCSGSDPVVVARALVDCCAASVLYVADLDGIMRGTPQAGAVALLARELPGVELWLDAGFTDPASALALITQLPDNVTPVFGSETLRADTASYLPHDAVLSLDQRHAMPLGDATLWHDATHWPSRVIVMSLDRVGSFGGPDLATVADIRRRAGNDRTIVGAGGVRNVADLSAAAEAGADAWLIASALHEGSISAQ